jgi:hypothetical protein
MFGMTGQAFTIITAFIISGIISVDVGIGLLIYIKKIEYHPSFPVFVILTGMLVIIMVFIIHWIPCTGHQVIPWMGEIVPADVCAKIGI